MSFAGVVVFISFFGFILFASLRLMRKGASQTKNSKFSAIRSSIPAQTIDHNKPTDDLVYVYKKGKAYHKTSWCSEPKTLPLQISESKAIYYGLKKCRKCF